MITLENRIEIDRPVHEVFEFIAHVENVQKWQPAVIESKRITEGPIRVGTQFKEAGKMMGRRLDSICEVTELEPDKRFAFKGTSNGLLEYQTTYVFEPQGNATRLHIVGTFRVKGFWGLLEPLFKGEVRSESEHELQLMKQAIEGRK